MSIKKFGVVMVAILALGAVMASSAFATATTEAKQWYTGTTETGVTTLAEGTTQAVTAEIGEYNGTLGKKFELKSTVGTSNTPIYLTATELHCISISGCVIHNIGPGPVVAVLTGTWVFTHVTVMEPSACKVKEEKITSNPLTDEAHYMEGTKALQKFSPASGEPGFATITLEAGTGACGISGSYSLKTTTGLFSETTNATGVFRTEQPEVFSPTINSAAGGNLFVQTASHPAELTGKSILKAGGKYFGIK